MPVSSFLDLKAEETGFGPTAHDFLKSDPLEVMSVNLSALASLSSTPLPRRVGEISVPIMAIHAENDNIFPLDYVKGIFDRLACEKEFMLLEGVPHLVMTNNADEIVPGVSEWLNRFLRPHKP